MVYFMRVSGDTSGFSLGGRGRPRFSEKFRRQKRKSVTVYVESGGGGVRVPRCPKSPRGPRNL